MTCARDSSCVRLLLARSSARAVDHQRRGRRDDRERQRATQCAQRSTAYVGKSSADSYGVSRTYTIVG